VSIGIWEAGKEGKNKRFLLRILMPGNKLSPSTTTTYLWNSALELEGVVGPMFENENLQMGQVEFPLES
jgi:hypothetical protein